MSPSKQKKNSLKMAKFGELVNFKQFLRISNKNHKNVVLSRVWCCNNGVDNNCKSLGVINIACYEF